LDGNDIVSARLGPNGGLVSASGAQIPAGSTEILIDNSSGISGPLVKLFELHRSYNIVGLIHSKKFLDCT